jgi:hypothetical protein
MKKGSYISRLLIKEIEELMNDEFIEVVEYLNTYNQSLISVCFIVFVRSCFFYLTRVYLIFDLKFKLIRIMNLFFNLLIKM